MSQGFGDTLTAPKSPKPSGLIFDIWPPKVVPPESVRLGCYFFNKLWLNVGVISYGVSSLWYLVP